MSNFWHFVAGFVSGAFVVQRYGDRVPDVKRVGDRITRIVLQRLRDFEQEEE